VYTAAKTALSLLGGASTSGLFVQTKIALPKASAAVKDPVDALVAKMTPEQQAKYKQAQAGLQQTLQQLKTSTQNSNAERKANAAQKIAQIKAQLQMVRLMAATDPKAAARMAAQLSRELAAAVREYTGSSGGADVGASAANASSANSPVVDDAVVTEDSNTAGSTTTVTATTSEETTKTDDTAPSAADKDQEQRDKYREGLNAQIAHIQEQAGKIQADVEFKKMVHEMVNQLRSVMEQAKRAQQRDGKKEPGFDEDISNGVRALKDVEKSLNEMDSSNLGDTTVSAPVMVDTSTATPVTAAPSVDITV
jgi:hypothetical protein